jgi:two-component system, OmpR family, response regulator
VGAEVQRKRVLVVDDDETILKLIGRVLQECEVNFDVARDGVQALQKLAGAKYDIAIIDLVMPDFDGLQLLERISDLMIEPPMVVVITAHSKELRHRLDSGLVNMVIRKPFDARELAAMIKNCLDAAPRSGSNMG